MQARRKNLRCIETIVGYQRFVWCLDLKLRQVIDTLVLVHQSSTHILSLPALSVHRLSFSRSLISVLTSFLRHTRHTYILMGHAEGSSQHYRSCLFRNIQVTPHLLGEW